MADMSQEQKACQRLAEDLETMIAYRAESGLFLGDDAGVPKKLLASVADARAKCTDDVIEARRMLGDAYIDLQNLVAQKGAGWRFYNVSGGVVYIYYTALLAIFLETTIFYEFVISTAHVGVIPLEAGIYGMLGGILRGLWWLHKKVEAKSFRRQFLMPFIAGPWLALLLGMFAWALVKAGLLVTGDGAVNPEDAAGTIALIILAGFSWEWVMAKLDPLIKGS